jgi:hypothetical protein
MTQVIDVLERVLSVYALGLILLGTIGNLLVFVICMKNKHLRITNAFKLLAFMSISDIFSLFEWNLNHFTYTYFELNLFNSSLIGCRFLNFTQNVSLQFSAWILV